MLTRVFRPQLASSIRRIPARFVTTDAASSHIDADAVPKVCSHKPSKEMSFDYSTELIYQEDDKPFEVRLSDESFETYELDPPSYSVSTTKKELKQMYYDMVAIRYELVLLACQSV